MSEENVQLLYRSARGGGPVTDRAAISSERYARVGRSSAMIAAICLGCGLQASRWGQVPKCRLLRSAS